MDELSDYEGITRREAAEVLGIYPKQLDGWERDYGCQLKTVKPDERDPVSVISSEKSRRRRS
ncbi:MAG: helix-turn-helix domain-containing protein [Opitutaceae bacterium]